MDEVEYLLYIITGECLLVGLSKSIHYFPWIDTTVMDTKHLGDVRLKLRSYWNKLWPQFKVTALVWCLTD